MHRFLTPLPDVYDLGQLGSLTASFWPGMHGCNEVDDDGTPSLAVYLDDPNPDLAAWSVAVAGHVPDDPAPAAPSLDEQVAELQATATALLALLEG